MKALAEVLTQTHHGYYMKHLESNFKSNFNKDTYLIGLFWRVASTYRIYEFEKTNKHMDVHYIYIYPGFGSPKNLIRTIIIESSHIKSINL